MLSFLISPGREKKSNLTLRRRATDVEADLHNQLARLYLVILVLERYCLGSMDSSAGLILGLCTLLQEQAASNTFKICLLDAVE